MKLDMTVTEVKEGRKTFLKLLAADKKVKSVSTMANAIYNSYSYNWFAISSKGISVYPASNGYVDEEILRYLDLNFEAISKYAEQFIWNGTLDFELNELPKIRMIVWLMKEWTSEWSQSPYGESFYNSHDIDWGYKPEGSLRVSDHWNFGEDGEHCPTAEPVEGWAVCRYENGVYHLIKKF